MSRVMDKARKELIRMVYVPMKYFEWTVPVEFKRNETEVIRLEMGVNLGQGFMPVFFSREEAEKQHPGSKILEITMLSTKNTN